MDNQFQTQSKLSNLWWLLLLEGISTFILGLLLLTQPASTSAIIVVFVGVYWLVLGIFAIVRIFTKGGRAHWGWSLVTGIIGIIAGILVLGHPVLSTIVLAETLVLVIAIAGIVMGVLDIVRGAQGDGAGAIILGVLSILIGIWLLVNPFASAVAVPLMLGIFGLIGGILMIIHAFRLRKLFKEMTA